MNMKINKIEGLYVPLITPFYKGEFDKESMLKLIKSIDPFVSGYIPCLSSGEGHKLTFDQWSEISSFVRENTNKPVFSGILNQKEDQIFKMLDEATKLQLNGVVIPTTFKTDQENFNFLKKVVSQYSGDIIVYNTEDYPLKHVEVFQEIDGLKQVVAVKDSSMNMNLFKNLQKLKSSNKLNMNLFQGMEHLLLKSKGCNGYIISLLNTEPLLCKSIFENQTTDINRKVIEQFWLQNLGASWYITIKAILYQRGVIKSAEQINPEIQPTD